MHTKIKSILTLILIISCINILSADQFFKTSNMQSVVLEDFELDESGKPKRYWVAVPNRFGKEGSKESGKSLQEVSWIESWPEAYFGRDGVFDDGNGPKTYKNCLAVKIQFNRQGYNSVELYPLEEKDGKYYKKPIPFVGKVSQIDLWIWGSNYNYEMEVVLMDYKGTEHRLPIGSIRHVGWKNFTVAIPGYIPQAGEYILGDYQFSLVKLVIWTNPSEKVSGTYVYIDHIKYLTDIFARKYDGYNLGDKETVKNLWEKAPKAPEDTEIVNTIQ